MSDYLLEPKTTLSEIANAIREKTGSTESMTVSQMASLIGGIETGGGTPTVGTHKVAFGQFTPSEVQTGEFHVATGLKEGTDFKTIHYIAIWIDDFSVVANYSTDTIMVSASRFRKKSYSTIQLFSNGSEQVQNKSRFGIGNSYDNNGFYVAAHANWKVQPETYNYMIVYDE